MTPEQIIDATKQLDDQQFLMLIELLQVEKEERRKRLIERLETQIR